MDHGSRRIRSGHRVGRERRDEGRRRVSGGASRRRRHHDRERARFPQVAARRLHAAKGRCRVHGAVHVRRPSTTTNPTRSSSARRPTRTSTTRSSSSRTRATSTPSATACRPSTTSPPRFRALEDSNGCFTNSDPLRTRHALSIDGFQASWTQAWTPTSRRSSRTPRRSSTASSRTRTAASSSRRASRRRSTSPSDRARQAVALRLNCTCARSRRRCASAARVYRDTWDIKSGTGELEVEKYLVEASASPRAAASTSRPARLLERRLHRRRRPLGPKGQYWTGDRELSPFSSVALGLRAHVRHQPAQGRLLGS